MMNEIYQRGPIVCGIAVTQALENYTGGVFNDTTGDLNIVHDISVVGYGIDENGVNYWHVRNSWGTFWGENGFFRIVRGTNNLAIETSCAWAAVRDTWTKNEKNVTTTETEKKTIVEDFSFFPERKTCVRESPKDRAWKVTE